MSPDQLSKVYYDVPFFVDMPVVLQANVFDKHTGIELIIISKDENAIVSQSWGFNIDFTSKSIDDIFKNIMDNYDKYDTLGFCETLDDEMKAKTIEHFNVKVD